MSQQIRDILFPSLFYSWVQQFQTTFELEQATTLIEEGYAGRELLLLIDGTADVLSEQRSGEATVIAVLDAPEILGEMSFLEGRPTVASVVGRAKSRWIRLPFETLRDAINSDPALAADFYSVLARKLALQLQNQNSMVHRWNSSEIEPLRKVLLVFAELDDLDIDWLSRLGTVVHCQPGQTLIEQGNQLDQLWVVLEGEADIFLITSEQRQLVGSSRRGELLGEMALLSSESQATASVIARKRMQLLALPQQQLKQRIEADATFGERFHRALAMLLSHRCRDQLMSHGLASRAASNEAIDFDTLDNISNAGRRFDWLCRQLATA